MFLGALSMRLDWTFETAVAVDSGMVVCDNSGVVGSETPGGGIKLSSGSCESMLTMFVVVRRAAMRKMQLAQTVSRFVQYSSRRWAVRAQCSVRIESQRQCDNGSEGVAVIGGREGVVGGW